MTFLLVAIVVLGVLALVSARNRRSVEDGRRQVGAERLAEVKRAADDDVTEFGEELQRLDIDLAGRELDTATRQDYQRALDAYEDAKSSVDAVTAPDEVRHVTEILEDGRYAIACVHARVAGEPLPQRRSPCFFNPAHGPSVRDVTWSPDRGAARQVPACAADAERVEAGAEPDSRQVMVGAQRMPYWQAGPTYAPWAAGYFGGFGLMEMMFVGTLMGSAFGDFDGSYDSGYDDGYDAGQDDGSGQGDGSDGYDGGSDGYDGGSDGYDGGGYDGGGNDMSASGYDGGYDSGGGFDGGGFDGGGFDGGGFDGGGFDGGF
jgi:hypothetical protein